jgi:hypothetical protein
MIADIGKTYLRGIPHEGGEISFEYPAYRGCYRDVADEIDDSGLARPSSSEIASLLRDSWKNPSGKYESKILNISINDWLLEFSGNLYIPRSRGEISEGIIIEQNPEIIEGKLIMDKDSLIRRLQEDDSMVRFVASGFKMGKQYPREIEKNPYIIARYGEEGASKIAEISSKYSFLPNLSPMSIFKGTRETKPRLSVLHDDFGKGLNIFCEWGYEDRCHSFGRVHERK